LSDGLKLFWPGGTTVEFGGTFTKTAVGGVGVVIINPSASANKNNEWTLMYGHIATQTHAGGGDTFGIDIQESGSTALAQYLRITMDANQSASIPTAFADATVNVDNDIAHTEHSNMICGTDRWYVWYEDMAVGETYTLLIKFRSRRAGAVPESLASGGTFA
jgi:hypothetical protein